jgi:hypothetical protein
MPCEDVCDHDVEVYVLNQLQDEAIRSHFLTCPHCAERISDCRTYIAAMKTALAKLQKQPRDNKSDDPDHGAYPRTVCPDT